MTPSDSSTSRDPSGERAHSRRGQLALAFQEVLTVTARLRANRQAAADADSFRSHVKHLLSIAEREARPMGYSPEHVTLALYAVVVLVDESVLNSALPIFAAWPSKPLQEEIFGRHIGGEIFFQHVRDLLGHQDSEDLADVLEVYQLCLLLGFRGQYRGIDRGEVRGLVSAVAEKIARIRGPLGELSPAWAPPPGEAVPRVADRWARGLLVGMLAAFVLAVVLFFAYRQSLRAGAAEFRALADQAASTR
jgi:type VI secretion system protein ImpK